MVNEDMPHYRQFPNACGLTSLLMALKSESRHIAEILDGGWDKVGAMFQAPQFEVKEFRYQRVLEYLLTACTQHPTVRAYLRKRYHRFAAEVSHWMENTLLNQGAPVSEKPNPKMLTDTRLIMRRVQTMKHDPELKVLAFLFGCKFVPWPKTHDGTGAVYFERDDLLKARGGHESGEFKRKFAFIQKGIHAGGPVVWGSSFHWLAGKDLQEVDKRYVLTYHDPMGGGEHSTELSHLRENDRFYIFSFDPKVLEERVPVVRAAFDLPRPKPPAPRPAKPGAAQKRAKN